MTLQLDARQRAMLAEMGIRLFDAEPATTEEAPKPHARPSSAAASAAAATAIAAAAAGTEPRLSRPIPQPRAPVPGTEADGSVACRPAGLEAMDWDALEQAVASCQACALCASRRNTVFGMGDREADWLIVGEAPGEQEDLQGEPFAGQSGKLLDNMLAALGLDRQQKVYLTNALKCRPPGDRNPAPEEVSQCESFLRRQVELLQPRIILAMGRFAVQALLQTTEPIGKLRGRAHQYNGVPVVVTYHPVYLLRNLADKGKAWADLCLAQSLLRERP